MLIQQLVFFSFQSHAYNYLIIVISYWLSPQTYTQSGSIRRRLCLSDQTKILLVFRMTAFDYVEDTLYILFLYRIQESGILKKATLHKDVFKLIETPLPIWAWIWTCMYLLPHLHLSRTKSNLFALSNMHRYRKKEMCHDCPWVSHPPNDSRI